MAEPMSAVQFAARLRAEGVTVVEVDGWETRNRNHKGPWGPVHGVMIHHTVTRGDTPAQTDASVALCRDGHSTLPGPLCHGVIDKQGVVHLVGYGRTNHAGAGDGDVLQAVIDEAALPVDDEANTDGNRYFYGFECINFGDGGDPWPTAQLLAIERVSAAICRHHGWGARSVIGHLEWQPGKVDPRGFSMQTMRGRVAARLDGNEEDDVALTTDDINKVALATANKLIAGDGVLENSDVTRVAAAVAAKLQPIEAAQSATIDKLVGAVATLAANIGDLDPTAIIAELRASIESITIHLDVPDA
jgi:hypothetical protein